MQHQRRATDRPALRAQPAQRAEVRAGVRKGEVCITLPGHFYAPSFLLDRHEAQELGRKLLDWCDLADATRTAAAPEPLIPA